MLQRWRPRRIVYLTDGGGADRVEQTWTGLDGIGLRDRGVFLDHAENEFYARLLARDADFFAQVARQVAEVLAESEADSVLADAVEFYNPVHDLATPIAHRARILAGRSEASQWEIPLVAEIEAGSYLIQRSPSPGRSGTLLETEVEELSLSADELATKRRSRDEVYTLLREQFGDTLQNLSDDHLGREVRRVAPASGFRLPERDYVVRYEWRARRLREAGEIEEEITLRGHFLPSVESLIDAP